MARERIAVDTSKSVLTLHGVDGRGRPILRRDRSEGFPGESPSAELVSEACGGSRPAPRVVHTFTTVAPTPTRRGGTPPGSAAGPRPA